MRPKNLDDEILVKSTDSGREKVKELICNTRLRKKLVKTKKEAPNKRILLKTFAFAEAGTTSDMFEDAG